MPSQVTPFKNKKAWWKCSNGHEWYTLISTRSGGSKCPYCSGIITLKGFNDFKTLYPDLAAEWSDKNGDLKPDQINEKSTKNVWWTCKKCGNVWKGVVKSRVNGRKCPVCSEREVLAGYLYVSNSYGNDTGRLPFLSLRGACDAAIFCCWFVRGRLFLRMRTEPSVTMDGVNFDCMIRVILDRSV